MMKHQLKQQLLQLNQMKMLTLTVDKAIVGKEINISDNSFKIEHLKRKLVFRCATL